MRGAGRDGEEFRNRPLTGRYPYLWLDAKYVKVREGGRVLSMALVVAMGVNENGEREVLGFDVGLERRRSRSGRRFCAVWSRRGLKDVLLVISDAHEGLKEAIRKVLGGSSWQRCRVHFMRNLLSQVPKIGAADGCGPCAHDLCAARQGGGPRPAGQRG